MPLYAAEPTRETAFPGSVWLFDSPHWTTYVVDFNLDHQFTKKMTQRLIFNRLVPLALITSINLLLLIYICHMDFTFLPSCVTYSPCLICMSSVP